MEFNHFSDKSENEFKYAQIVKTMDMTYYPEYSKDRYELHTSIIDLYIEQAAKILEKSEKNITPTITFMAGCYGSGKSHTVEYLRTNGLVNMDKCIYVDQDIIRFKIPEFYQYVRENAWSAGENTQVESGYISEIIQKKVLEMGCDIIVDGSLHDKWYSETYIPWIRNTHPEYIIMVIYVKTDWNKILERCWERCEETKRCIRMNLLKKVFTEMPESVNKLSNLVDAVIEINNNENPIIDKIIINKKSISKLYDLVNKNSKILNI